MLPVVAKRFLHVANGDCTTRIIRDAGIPGTLSIWADVLHEGPVPGGLSDEELLQVRAGHLAETPDRLAATVAGLYGWRAALDGYDSYDELILWYEHDLFDQLNLVQVLSRIRQTLPAARPVSLVCIGSFPGRLHFKGLGELKPVELAPLMETRRAVSDTQFALAERAWLAFRAPNPREIEDLLRLDTSALPFLAAALRRHLEEFPSTTNGLSRTENRLMELAEPGPIDLRTAFPLMHAVETAFYIGDSSFWHVVQQLASAAVPLMALDVKSSVADRLPGAMVSLTDAGRDVLRGATDRVSRYGLDRWLGGVHLEGSAAKWRWDAAAGRIV
jgi:hypothetical protein